MKNNKLIKLGFYIPAIFWITLFVSGFIQEDYNHLSRQVSDLGTIGTKSQFIFSTGLVFCSILSVLFVIGLYNASKIIGLSVIPIIVILTFSVSIAGAAIFPLPLRMHSIMGMPSVLLIFSPLLSFLQWKGKNKLPNVKLFSIICFLIMSLGFIVFFPEILQNYIGLKQRFFHLGWTVWFIYLSFSFRRNLKQIN